MRWAGATRILQILDFMNEPERWVVLAVYPAAYEAEMIAAQLQNAGFVARIDAGEAVGIFGASFQGATSQGTRVLVPSSQLEAARAQVADVSGTA
jgi:hypothetical protein